MTSEENARLIAMYNAARAEVIQRIALREQVLLGYVATTGVIAGIAFKSAADPDGRILAAIPLLSVPFTIALLRHDWLIRRLGSYLEDLRTHVAIPRGAARLLDWDGSATLHYGLRTFLLQEKLIFLFLICIPSGVGEWLFLRTGVGLHHPVLRSVPLAAAILSFILLARDLVAVLFRKMPHFTKPGNKPKR